MTVKVMSKISAPSLPHFIRVRGEAVPIAEFSDSELEAIADDWKRRLIETARKKRERPSLDSEEKK